MENRNCTTVQIFMDCTVYDSSPPFRLAQQLQDQEEPDGVQSLLVDFVSLSCFLLPPPEECPGTAQGSVDTLFATTFSECMAGELYIGQIFY